MINHEADAEEANDHHSPSGGFGDRGNGRNNLISAQQKAQRRLSIPLQLPCPNDDLCDQ
jgi:hypothetical protein